MKKVCFASFAAAVLAASLATAGHAFADPVIVNGSFEDPAYTDDGIYSGTAGTGWIRTFMGPVAVVRGNVEDSNGVGRGATPFGDQYLGLDARYRGFIAGASQTISGFVAGQTYELTLYVADSDGGTSPILEMILGNGSGTNYVDQTYNVPFGGPYVDFIQFNKVVVPFTSPVDGNITLSLLNASAYPGPPASISIDNVSLAAVPEPGSIAATALGVVALAGCAVRRRQAQA